MLCGRSYHGVDHVRRVPLVSHLDVRSFMIVLIAITCG